MEEEKITLSVNQINQILDYLGKKPYLEVVGLINMIHSEYEKQKEENNKTDTH